MEEELMKLCEQFLQMITTMYKNGKITEDEFKKMCEKKIELLEKCGVAS